MPVTSSPIIQTSPRPSLNQSTKVQAAEDGRGSAVAMRVWGRSGIRGISTDDLSSMSQDREIGLQMTLATGQ
jgi:hypothetical protein